MCHGIRAVSSLAPSVFPPVFAGHYRYYPRFGNGRSAMFLTNRPALARISRHSGDGGVVIAVAGANSMSIAVCPAAVTLEAVVSRPTSPARLRSPVCLARLSMTLGRTRWRTMFPGVGDVDTF